LSISIGDLQFLHTQGDGHRPPRAFFRSPLDGAIGLNRDGDAVTLTTNRACVNADDDDESTYISIGIALLLTSPSIGILIDVV